MMGGTDYEIAGLHFRSGLLGTKAGYHFPVPAGEEATAVYKVKVEEVSFRYQIPGVSDLVFKRIQPLEDPFVMAEYVEK
ncbi:hypothetical protein [Streptococcus ovuberis]|uniref:Uncharacterized protein n=1 Tax=Streptococcus ovuberis TaxID=1936207 RepID=A0A7X6MXB1_9STRE|nr:hypothetical protein [Streptococcus ovuberis]NKZ20085.1 hypothetical protein [Streptococcus ovuberis]